MTGRGPSFLNWQVHDATMRFLSAPPEHKLARARKLVDAKFERGDFADILQAMDEATRDAMARRLVDGKAIRAAPDSERPA